ALCLHGFPECWYSWRHQMPLLAKLGHRVWAPDLRGYGESDRPLEISDYAIEALMDDVAGLIDASGGREATAVCQDWGGIVGWCFATRKIRPLARLVCMNVPHLGAGLEAAGVRQRLRSWYMLFFQLPWLPERVLTGGGARRIGRMFRESAKRPEAFDDPDVQGYHQNALPPDRDDPLLPRVDARRRLPPPDRTGLPDDRDADAAPVGHRGRRARHGARRADRPLRARSDRALPAGHRPLGAAGGAGGREWDA